MDLSTITAIFKQSWEAVSAIVALALYFLFKKVSRVDEDVKTLNLDMTKNYVSKQSFEKAVIEIKDQNKELRQDQKEMRLEHNNKLDKIILILDRKVDK